MSIVAQDFVILIAEDDEDDYQLIKEALDRVGIGRNTRWVKDGVDLLDYLHRRGAYARAGAAPIPSLILLDLIMPKKSGHEALRDIKADSQLRSIPVVVLTTSNSREDIQRAYQLGISSLIRKPLYFEEFIDIAKMLKRYWCHTASLPRDEPAISKEASGGLKGRKAV